MIVITDAWKLLALNLKATYLANPNGFIGLYTNVIAPSRSTLFSAIVEASFPGYARVPIVFPGSTAAYINGAGFGQIDRSALAVFTPSSITAGQQVQGYFVCANGPPIGLWWIEPNPNGQQLVGATLLPYVVQISMQESQYTGTGP